MEISAVTNVGDVMTAFHVAQVKVAWPADIDAGEIIVILDATVDDEDAAQALAREGWRFADEDEDCREPAPDGMLADLVDALVDREFAVAQALVDRIYDGREQYEVQRAIGARMRQGGVNRPAAGMIGGVA